ncbi:hypothetical protein SAMN04487831_106136 [Pseudobutyrivibrio sp. UC1225]|uniref:hypothetical protein n=1 Tax=Pseudobutyrivibrio sp. UC1225 TaxID=1798185 RepID=UPI0008DF061C|nr:hypothetical protein [Pseudobutyrivibrio sp. UC1225]SFO03764.1 hypothetical protein SAMN04487831_106136 [Pseudobutyrivibrio sp. UC1225]
MKDIRTVLLIAYILICCSGCCSNNTIIDKIDEADHIVYEMNTEKIIAEEFGCFWAASDGNNIIYIQNGKLFKYEIDTGTTQLVTDAILNPYDLEICNGTIFSVEYKDGSNNAKIYKYDSYADQFIELIDLPYKTIQLISSNHYLVACDMSSGVGEEYRVYDITNPDSPKEISQKKIDIVKENRSVIVEDNGNIFFRDMKIFDNSKYGYDQIDIWGYNKAFIYISGIDENGVEDFYSIEIGSGNVCLLGDNIKKIAVFDACALIKMNDGGVTIINQ